MGSIQLKILRFLIKSQFSGQGGDPAIDLAKARRFDRPIPPRGLQKRLNIEKRECSGRNVYYMTKQQHPENGVILYFHGGAFFSGMIKAHWNFTGQLCSMLNCRVVLPDYPLTPEADHRETLQFVLTIYKRLLQEYPDSVIYLMGDSSGGNLCLSLSLMLSASGLPRPHKIILLSPWLDLSMNNPEIRNLEEYDIMLSSRKLLSAGRLYAADADLDDPKVSPLYGDLASVPETFVFTGSHDILMADARKLKAMAEERGLPVHIYEYGGMMHVWMLFPIPEARPVIRKIVRIIRPETYQEASPGGVGAVKVFVSSDDREKAQIVVRDYENNKNP